jgi:hypothetical protein
MKNTLNIISLICAFAGTILLITRAAPLPVAIGISIVGVVLVGIVNLKN